MFWYVWTALIEVWSPAIMASRCLFAYSPSASPTSSRSSVPDLASCCRLTRWHLLSSRHTSYSLPKNSAGSSVP
ncbi:hypothetical protein F4780DRAFT_741744 [Xylariomycetidae sp. FL0641]|nr:hypothetical protein F4780DRAFT_741744 [Xylariomycetidae sp. FL0641]